MEQLIRIQNRNYSPVESSLLCEDVSQSTVNPVQINYEIVDSLSLRCTVENKSMVYDGNAEFTVRYLW